MVRTVRTIIAWLVSTLVLGGTAAVAVTVSAQAATSYTATGSVNIRSGPSTKDKILGVLKKGKTITARGAVSKGWLPVTYSGKKAFVSASWVKKTPAKSSGSTTTPTTTKQTTANVNIRSTASLTASIVATVPKGTKVTLTGTTSGKFSQITYNSASRWIFTQYLGAVPATDTTPKVVATLVTTTALTLRTAATNTAGSNGSVAANTKVGITGNHSGSYSQILLKDKLYWVLTGYLKSSGTGPAVTLPAAKAIRYISADGVNVRSKADAESSKVATLARGIAIQTTGTVSKGFTQIIYSATTAWVASEYVSATKPVSTTDLGSDSLNKLKATAKAAVVVIRNEFPEIKTIYGWRSSSSYSSDHPNGRAVDVMIPSWSTSSGKALGDKVANYFISNGKKYDVSYIIWRQRNYRITRGSWTTMEDRGGSTANHMDHVHLSFNA